MDAFWHGVLLPCLDRYCHTGFLFAVRGDFMERWKHGDWKRTPALVLVGPIRRLDYLNMFVIVGFSLRFDEVAPEADVECRTEGCIKFPCQNIRHATAGARALIFKYIIKFKHCRDESICHRASGRVSASYRPPMYGLRHMRKPWPTTRIKSPRCRGRRYQEIVKGKNLHFGFPRMFLRHQDEP